MKKRDSATHRSLLWALCALSFVGPASLQVQAQGGRSNYIPRTERGRLAEQIVLRWSVEGAKQLDTTPRGWAGAMGSAFAQSPIEQLRRAASAATFDQLKDSFQSASIGTQALGDLVFRSIPPCRIVNTRSFPDGSWPILANTTRSFLGQIDSAATSTMTFTVQGGHNSKCGIPNEAVALALQVLAARPEGDGHLTVFPSGTMPEASSLNYRPGQNISNELPVMVVPAAGSPGKKFQVFSNQNTNFVADVVGFYVPLVIPPPPEKTHSLKCFELAPKTTSFEGQYSLIVTPNECGSGHARTSIRCWSNHSFYVTSTARPNDCAFNAIDGETQDTGEVYVSATCCRIE